MTPRAALGAAILAMTLSAQAATPGGGVDSATRDKLVASVKSNYALPVEPAQFDKAGLWAFRQARDGVYEVDTNPDKDGFANADFAVDGNGQLVLNYGALFSLSDYNQMLVAAGISESKDGRGRVNMFLNGAAIPSFDAFCLLSKERFLRKYARTPQERGELDQLLSSRKWFPADERGLVRGPGPVAVKVVQTEPFQVGEAKLVAADAGSVPTAYADVLSSLQLQTALVPSVGMGRRRGN